MKAVKSSTLAQHTRDNEGKEMQPGGKEPIFKGAKKVREEGSPECRGKELGVNKEKADKESEDREQAAWAWSQHALKCGIYTEIQG